MKGKFQHTKGYRCLDLERWGNSLDHYLDYSEIHAFRNYIHIGSWILVFYAQCFRETTFSLFLGVFWGVALYFCVLESKKMCKRALWVVGPPGATGISM